MLLAHADNPIPATPAPSAPPAPLDANALVQKIQGELGRTFPPPEGKEDPAVPHGDYLNGSISDTEFYPGTTNDFTVYVPKQYDPAKPACLLVKLDGLGGYEGTVLDNLIAKKEVPVIIAVGINPGHVFRDPPGTPDRRVARFNRCFQFDSMNDRFPEFVITKLLPQVETMKTPDGRAIHLSTNPDDRATMGTSSGAICAFNLAWRRPDQFHRVFDSIGTFVAMRGGHEFPALIRKTEPKPIRVFLEDGSQDAWNLNLGSWFEANTQMESALTFAGYDVAHAWGTHGHDGSVGAGVMPDVMRWLWRDYPAPIKAGNSQNDKLGEILVQGEGWTKADELKNATGLASSQNGDVWATEMAYQGARKVGDPTRLYEGQLLSGAGVQGLATGPDGLLYEALPAEKKIAVYDLEQHAKREINGIAAHSLLVTHDGTIYASEPGKHSDMPSTIWRIKPDGTKTKMDEGLQASSGIAFSPDGALFFAAENTSKWVYSYLADADGTFSAKQPFDWLHISDFENDSGAQDLAFDMHGNLYVATRIGIQVCDQNGRTRAIIPLPTPCGPVRSFCFGGPAFDELYVTDGKQVWKRKVKVPGYQPWMAPVAYPSQGEG